MLKAIVKFLILTEAFAIVTFAGGWSGVPVVAFVWALLVGPRGRPVLFATICSATAWATLLILDFVRGPLAEVASRVGSVMGVPPVTLYAITLLFAAILAWSASTIGAAIRKFVVTRRARSKSPMIEPTPMTNAPDVVVADA